MGEMSFADLVGCILAGFAALLAVAYIIMVEIWRRRK